MKKPFFWGIHADPRQSSVFATSLSLTLFVGVIFFWWLISAEDNRFFPTFGQMGEAIMERLTVNEFAVDDPAALGFWESLQYRVMIMDIYSSLKLLGGGVAVGSVIGLVWGLYLGSFPGLRQLFGAFTVFASLLVVSMFQPLIFKTVGFDTFGKICLIAFGIVFFIALSTFQAVKNIPEELRIKALTLGFSSAGLIHRVILPLILPRWIGSIRFALLIAWTFLIMSEFISSEFGLGHEVYKSIRQLQMEVMIPYGMIATLLAFGMDRLLRLVIVKGFPYYKLEE